MRDISPDERAEPFGLTDEEIVVLIIAGTPDYPAGTREKRVHDLLGWSMTTYAAALNRLLDDQRALAYNPLLINGQRRLRDERMARKGH